MSKFKLSLCQTLDDRWTNFEDEILRLQRKHQNVEIILRYIEDDYKLWRVMKLHGSHVRSLHFGNGNFSTAARLRGILSELPLVESLKFSSCNVLTNAKNQSNSLNISLTHLIFEDSSWRIMDFIKAPNLKFLKVHGGFQGHAKSLTAFLSASYELTSIAFDETSFESTFASEIIYEFQLVHLEIQTYDKLANTRVEQNFNEFLKKQKRLEQLDLRYCASQDVIDTVFNCLSNLTSLKIVVTCFPDYAKFYKKFKLLNRLKLLEVYGDFPNKTSAKEILKLCPNIEVLIVHNDLLTSSLLSFMASHNPQIKELSLATIYETFNPKFFFKNLKVFEIKHLTDYDTWFSFALGHKTIETLILKTFGSKTLHHVCLFDQLKHVKSFSFLQFNESCSF